MTRRKKMWVVRTAPVVCSLLVGAPLAPAQSEPAAPAGQIEQTGEPDPAHLRARLSRMLDQLEQSASSVRGAIEKIDGGGSVAEAIDELGGPMRVREFSETWERWNRAGEERRPAPPGGRDPQGPPEEPREIDPRRVLAFLEEHAPEVAARIGEVRAGSPRRAEALLDRLTPRVAEILATRDQDPALADILTREFTIGMELLEVGGRLARARNEGDEGAADELRPRLRALAAEHVDVRLERREHEISLLTRRVSALREDLHRQQGTREQLIDDVYRRASEAWRDDAGETARERPRRGGRD